MCFLVQNSQVWSVPDYKLCLCLICDSCLFYYGSAPPLSYKSWKESQLAHSAGDAMFSGQEKQACYPPTTPTTSLIRFH